MEDEQKKPPLEDTEISGLIGHLIEEAAREDVPLRLRALARQLEMALDRRAQEHKKSFN